MPQSLRFRLDLLGPFGLHDPTDDRIEITSKRGRALIAMLATGKEGARARAWLQDMLWGSRAPAQAQASLRRELSNLRPLLNRGNEALLGTGHGRIWLDLDRFDIDFAALEQASRDGGPFVAPTGQFLEGLDLPGEEGFEDWLRHQRSIVEDLSETAYPPLRPPAAERAADTGAGQPPASGGTAAGPVVGVLAFDDQRRGVREAPPAAQIAEELIELLARVRWIPVAAPADSLAWSPRQASLREIGNALGARYLVQGRLRDEGATGAIIVTLTSSESGRLLWSRRTAFRPSPSGEALRAQLVELVGALSSQIEDQEMRRAIALPEPGNVIDLIWRARWHNSQYTQEGSRTAESLLGEAIEKAPHSAEAIIQLAFCRQRDVWRSRGGAAQIRELRRLAQRAVAADGRDGRGYMVAGIAELWMRHGAAAVALLEQAIALNPALGYAYSQLGAAHYLSGRPDLALPQLEEALRIGMGEQHDYYVHGEMAMAQAMLGETEAAVAAADQSIMRRTAYWYAHVAKVHALASAGDLAAAADARVALQSAKPSFVPEFVDWVPFVERVWPERLKESLTIAERGERRAQRLRA